MTLECLVPNLFESTRSIRITSTSTLHSLIINALTEILLVLIKLRVPSGLHRDLQSYYLYVNRDSFSFDKMLLNLKLQACIVLPGVISAI